MMGLDRRELLERGLLLGGLLALAPHTGAEAASTDKKLGLIDISASGITTWVYQIAVANMTTQHAKLSGFQRLEPSKSGSPPPIALPLLDDVSAAGVAATVDLIAGRIDRLIELKVKKTDIYLVMSSGVAQRVMPVLKQLARDVRARTGLPLATVTARDEARLQFDWLVAPFDRGRVFQFDVGSGNTKGGSYDRRGWKGHYADFSIPFGTKTLAAAVKERSPDVDVADFPARTREFYDQAIAPQLTRESAKSLGKLKNPRIILSGGAVWAATVISHPREMISGRDFIDISPDNLNQVIQSIQKGIFYGIVPSDIQGDDRKKLLKMRENVRNVFNPHQLAAGVTLLACMCEQFDFDKAPKITFPTFSGNTWTSQFLLESSSR
ncbi:hypothetical protein [Sphingomonas crocodyli]|uniref:Ppx/GppA phosphatase domain-containing protein n=1 Tax=Sphingomonas crocodyli TaxID=1979270 RepID=A0A437MB20_9SPHN|nr:hypothetical protein [Sphingomonas crocodyli]RVT94816.1 hypothetical protein EOD43_13635 [Sphingomonas crocodyli]